MEKEYKEGARVRINTDDRTMIQYNTMEGVIEYIETSSAFPYRVKFPKCTILQSFRIGELIPLNNYRHPRLIQKANHEIQLENY